MGYKYIKKMQRFAGNPCLHCPEREELGDTRRRYDSLLSILKGLKSGRQRQPRQLLQRMWSWV